MSKMQELYELTKKFNDISGANKELSEKAFIEQYTYIREEFKELAVTVKDFGTVEYPEFNHNLSLKPEKLVNALDDCLDILITTFGFLQKLEALGVDTGQAGIDTAHNNLSKYPTSPAIAHETVQKVKIEKEIDAVATFNEEHSCYTIRNKATGKVIKPTGFVSNDLRKYITTQVKEKYVKHN